MRLPEYRDPFFNKCAEEILSVAKVLQMDLYLQHGRTTCLGHCIKVAWFSYLFCMRLKLDVDLKSLIHGALLHDFFLYDWHDKARSHRLHGFSHPEAALVNAQRIFMLNETERDIIVKHMWPMTLRPPKYREALIVCMIDKCCAAAETFCPLYSRILQKCRWLYIGRAKNKAS